MTTIAYRDGIMAADSCVANNAGTRLGRARKIHRLPDGTLAAGAGDFAAVLNVIDWLAAGQPTDERPAFEDETAVVLLLVHPDGIVGILETDLRECQVEGDYFAIGSGCEGALGAMAAGARAEEAVRIACGIDTNTSGPVMTEALNP